MPTAKYNIIASDLTKLTEAMNISSEGNNCISYSLHLRAKDIDECDRISTYLLNRWLENFQISEITENSISSFCDNYRNISKANVFEIRWDRDSKDNIYPDQFEYRNNACDTFYHFSVFEDGSNFGQNWKIQKQYPKCYTLEEIQSILNN